MSFEVKESVKAEIACVIVTYNPDRNIFYSVISQLLKSHVSIYIVDNWYSNESTGYVRELAKQHSDRIRLICLETNYGIAKALNIGVDQAIKDSHKYALLLDQDSIPQDGLLEEMLGTANLLSKTEPQTAAVGPRLYDPRSNSYAKFALLKWGVWKKIGCETNLGNLIKCEFLNSSGSLIFLRHWETIGSFYENFFIDHVETEWYMRVRYLGFKCYGLCSKSHLIHYMGDKVCRYWFFGWRNMPHRSPERHYTIVRNAIWLWKFEHVPFSWILNASLKIIFTFLYFCIFDGNGKMQAKYILTGIRDGLKKNSRFFDNTHDL
ncbi:glycosyltransferase family 2 protein [Methylomonas sp. MO1]|uniref:glycosyltransferase family 2 protein n=1 Tax=unclassified Methylomonas TaxID=2608980 RepID=UPI00047D1392|nr:MULTISPECIES: glycosyltransferase family 2 protein [unclassified Methylomonas]MDT4291368.1 glycosyltransferase family 2 protein [Methylomonas sp. MO1]